MTYQFPNSQYSHFAGYSEQFSHRPQEQTYHGGHHKLDLGSSGGSDLSNASYVYYSPPLDAGTRIDSIECPYKWCRRTGQHGFARSDDLVAHLQQMHGMTEPVKNAKAGNSKYD